MQLLVRWLMNQHKPHTIKPHTILRFCLVCLFVCFGMVFNYKLQNKFHLKSTWRKSLNSLIIIFAMNNCMEWMRHGISSEFVWSDRTEILDGDVVCLCGSKLMPACLVGCMSVRSHQRVYVNLCTFPVSISMAYTKLIFQLMTKTPKEELTYFAIRNIAPKHRGHFLTSSSIKVNFIIITIWLTYAYVNK